MEREWEKEREKGKQKWITLYNNSNKQVNIMRQISKLRTRIRIMKCRKNEWKSEISETWLECMHTNEILFN